ncbi:hypothetical protein ROZALSC1DRAFT_21195 [Rozella allomycis CSF55]|uniref:TspO/MBR-related protein n=1 Tax=Rozella allomycis (strain CSF55) TaxID=988480 RepID=A0A4P9YNS3_ROZAC|nr:hypothetical protein ROZALSC1DRAFT_21195 [Rozella allomycis CSF55]
MTLQKDNMFAKTPVLSIAAHLLIGFSTAKIAKKRLYPWYNNLYKPTWLLSAEKFTTSWAVIYSLMGISSFRIFKSSHELRNPALIAYASHLLLNFTWMPTFFAYHKLGLSSIILVSMTKCLSVSLALFYLIDPIAAYCLLPYELFSIYASIANIWIWKKNKDKKTILKEEFESMNQDEE